MALIRFTTTRLSGLQAAGRLQELQHSVIAPFLERELGSDYGRLFAEFEMEASDVRAWYADVDTAPRSISDMNAEEQADLRQRVAGMIAKVLEFAGRIGAESAQKANLARILTAATTFPIEDLWSAGSQPIIVNWGFHRQSVPEGTPSQIRLLIPEAPKPPRTPPPDLVRVAPQIIPRQPRGNPIHWIGPLLLWLVFLSGIASCFWLLLPACGVDRRWPILSGLPVLNACESQFDAMKQEGNRLQVLVEQEELRLAQHRRQCAIDGPPPSPPPLQQRTETPVPGAPVHQAETVPQDKTKLEEDVDRRLPHDTQRGAVEVSLIWDNEADLDLIIECPNGDKLWHGSNGFDGCGGHLTKDVNKSGDTLLQHPIEHASWPSSPNGDFTIKVQLWTYNTVLLGTNIPFTIRIRRGDEVRVIEGGHIKGERNTVTSTKTHL